jgi:glutamate-1-semialdehyde 2,1-aminomutase
VHDAADDERRILKRIPGGTQLLSKRPEQFAPGQWPRFYSRARGFSVWTTDGRKFTDMSTSGIGTCTLGFADEDVNSAVHDAIDRGTMSSLNCREDLELADLLVDLHPWADQVRFARTGGEAMSIAVRLARATTGRSVVAFCGYHGWHDWYLAANIANGRDLDGHLLPGLEPAGVPVELRSTAVPFEYNSLDNLEQVVSTQGKRLAAIVMEPVRGTEPAPGFLAGVRAIADRMGAVLIFDEVTSGLRVASSGIHMTLGVVPDIAVLAKSIGNGYPMAAVLGTAAVMSAAQKSFVSSTYWTELIGPTAALATLDKHRRLDVGSHLVRIGSRVQRGWAAAASGAGLDVAISGIAPLSRLSFNVPCSQAVATLFTQSMLDHGYLAGPSFYPSLAHDDATVDRYLAAVQDAFELLAKAISEESVERRLRGPVAQIGFARLT